METEVGLKSRMRENRTYGSVRGDRQAFHNNNLKGVSSLPTRLKSTWLTEKNYGGGLSQELRSCHPDISPRRI